MRPRHLIAAVLCLLIAYPLSIGPVMRIEALSYPTEILGAHPEFKEYCAPWLWFNYRFFPSEQLSGQYIDFWLGSVPHGPIDSPVGGL
jgi:hypothetical protein